MHSTKRQWWNYSNVSTVEAGTVVCKVVYRLTNMFFSVSEERDNVNWFDSDQPQIAASEPGARTISSSIRMWRFGFGSNPCGETEVGRLCRTVPSLPGVLK